MLTESMKAINIYIRFFLATLILLIILSCKDAVAPFESEYSLNEGKKLYILGGYYKQVSSSSGGQLKYFYEFSYFTLEECWHNGYALKYDSTAQIVSWWASLSLKANTLYHIADTIRTSAELRSNPTVFLFGYKVGSTANDSSFSAKYMLQPKK